MEIATDDILWWGAILARAPINASFVDQTMSCDTSAGKVRGVQVQSFSFVQQNLSQNLNQKFQPIHACAGATLALQACPPGMPLSLGQTIEHTFCEGVCPRTILKQIARSFAPPINQLFRQDRKLRGSNTLQTNSGRHQKLISKTTSLLDRDTGNADLFHRQFKRPNFLNTNAGAMLDVCWRWPRIASGGGRNMSARANQRAARIKTCRVIRLR